MLNGGPHNHDSVVHCWHGQPSWTWATPQPSPPWEGMGERNTINEGWIWTSVPYSRQEPSWSYNKHPIMEQVLTLYSDEGLQVLTWRGANWAGTALFSEGAACGIPGPTFTILSTWFRDLLPQFFSSNTLLLSTQAQCQYTAWNMIGKVLLGRGAPPSSFWSPSSHPTAAQIVCISPP